MISRAQFWRELRAPLCLLIALVVVAIPLLILAIAPWFTPTPRLTQVSVAGQVTDGGVPAAGARVVVTIEQFAAVGGRRHFYGLVADDDGRFSMNVTAPFRYHQAVVDAAGPNDTFGSAHVDDQFVDILLRPLPSDLAEGFPNERFSYFTGRFRFGFGIDAITFLNDPWEIRTPSEIESSYRTGP